MTGKKLYKTMRHYVVSISLILLVMAFGLYATGAMAQDQGGTSSVIIENNVITGNTGGSGGGIAVYNSLPVIRNNLLIENVSTGEDGGGAIYIFGRSSQPKITGNTISKNNANSANGGGIYVAEGEATISSCILWQNQGDLWNCDATYSNVTNLSANPGTGNISADPAFVQTTDPDAPGYYWLSENSPCVDAGDPAYHPDAKERDIKGKSRIVGVRVDIGADELLDSQGPAISDVRFNGTNLVNGMVLRESGTFTVSAADPSAVSRVEFSLDGNLSCTDTNGTDGYSCFWNIILTEDGPHTLTITAYDTLGNNRSISYTLNVALNPPLAPTITYPANGAVLRTVNITVSGLAEKNTTILLYNNNIQIGNAVSVDGNGNFRLPITLTEGINRLQATATNRAGTSPRSAEVVVTLDTSLPKAPLNLSAQSKAGGIIGLTWTSPSGTSVKGYNLYRATAVFSSTGEATKVNTSLITRTSFDDLPPANGTYYYAVSTVDQANLESPLSNIASAISDRTAPRAVSIEYMPSGRYDPEPLRIAQGLVNIHLIVSEPLLSTPFLSMTPNGGVPIPVDLTKTSDLEYVGSFMISESEPNGVAYAVFSGRDLVGNRGTSIDSGSTFIIDTQGPAISSIEIQPRQPIRNDQTNPVSIILTIGLNEPIKPGQAPELFYLLLGQGRTQTSIGQPSQISTQPGHAQTWQATFNLPADAGLAQVENLQFIYRGIDDLENVGTRILCDNSFQVYQGNLPPLSLPQNLTGKSLPGGKIKLSWTAVGNAAGYQLYRQSPNETQLTAYQVLGTVLEFTDTPPSDGLYKYAVASIRRENNQESISAMSNIVEVTSDATAPGSPQNLALQLTGSGIKAIWEAPPDTEPITYSLYRSNLPEITSVQGMTPILTRIADTTAIDSHPSHTDHSYVVTAVDDAGNESLPSNSFYLNFDLLPVSSLKVVQRENESPVISWTHPGGDIVGYNIYLVTNGPSEKLNQVLLTSLNYTDTGYAGDERHYTVTAVDRNAIESLGRSITLPKLSATLNEGEQIKRGIINRLEYIVDNHSSSKVEHVKLKALVGTYQHLSEEFSVDPSSSQAVSVPVGGYADLPDLITFTTTMEVTPQEGDLVQIVRSKEIEVVDDKLVLQILNEAFTRGGLGKVWFTLENTGEEEIEIITATGSGASASNEVTFYLLDADGNALSSKAYKQNLGQNVVTLSNGTTVARIPAGSIFTSNPIEISVPLTSPDQVSIHLEIAKIHYHYGQPDRVSISGLDATNQISLRDTAYYGAVIAITPESSTGEEDIIITGRAINRSTGLPMPSVPLNLVISVFGFERTYKMFTDNSGSFSFSFKPLPGESGIYRVRAVHPEVFDKPVQGQFVISRLSINPTTINLNIPKNYEQAANIQVTTGDGTIAHNLRLTYEEHDQPSGVFPEGVHITLGNPIALLGSKQTATLSFKIWADNAAAATGRIILQVKSDETGSDSWGSVLINTQFSEAQPALYYSPDHVETGVAYDQMVAETITLQNKGLADLNDVSLAVISQTGEAAPSWVHLNSASSQGVIAVGDQRQVSITFSPTSASVAEGVYSSYLRVTSSNYQTTDIRIYVSVTQSGIGNAIFKVSDIYTGTVNQNNQLIQGLSGAKITIQNEQVLTIEQTQNTDVLGEVLFTNLPPGTYKYRVSAANHQEQIGRLWIKPGLTVSEQVFLTYNLVTVEWEVRETTIQDKYEIVLHATYETNVPAAVVVIEPKSVTLPDMKAGGVFYGEFTVTNYGLIRADNMKLTLPPTDQYFKYELLTGLPESLEAQERITVPYRVTALTSINQSEEGGGSGGGCSSYSACITLGYSYKCANGVWTQSADYSCFTYVIGGCGPGGGTVPGGGAGGGGIITIGGPGGGGTGGGGTGPPSQPIAGVVCAGPRTCPVNDKCSECCINSREAVYSNVDLLRGEYTDDVTDMFIKVAGHRVEVKRWYYDDKWHFDGDNLKLEVNYAISGAIDYINKDGVRYDKTDTLEKVFSFKTDRYIYVKDDGYLWQDKSGNWAKFDLSGRMISYGNPNNVKVSMIYESGQNGKLIGIADNSGTQVLWYEYNTNGTLSGVRDRLGRRVQYFYDSSGRLSKVVDLLGNEAYYYYDSEGRITSKKDAAGRMYYVAYYDYGFVKSVTNENGIGIFFDYGYDVGRQERYSMVRYSSGKIVERWYDRFANNIRTDINGRTVQKLVKDGRTKIFTDAAGKKTYKEYDEWDNLLKQTNPDGTTVTYTYEPRFNKVIQQVNERGIVTKYEYDSSGNMLRKIEALGTTNERTTEYIYDTAGNPLSIKIVGDAKTSEAISFMAYDSSANLISETDPEGNTTQFTYDIMGNVLTREDARNKIWTYGYDHAGWLTSQTDPLNNTVSYEYDGVGNKTRETDPEGKVKTYEYDSNNRMVRMIDASSNSTQFVYNSDGNLIKQTDQEGKQINFEYDLDGRLVKTIDGNGNETTTEYNDAAGSSCSSCSGASSTGQPAKTIYPTYTKELKYDSRGRKIEEKDVLSATEAYSTQFGYDAFGNLVSNTDKEGKTTIYQYDELNRKAKVIDPLTNVREYTYDNRGNLIALTDARGNTTTFEYDRNNRLTKETRPLGQATAYQYDAIGTLIRKVDAKDQKTEYEYDDAGGLTKTKYFAAATDTTPIKTTDFTYNKTGNLVGYNDGTTSSTYTYDDAYQKLTEAVNYSSFSLSYAYTYYKNGLKKSLTMPDGTSYDYTYDNNNQVSVISIPAQGFMTYNSYTWNMPSTITLPGGTKKENTYTPLMQIKSLNAKDPAQNLIMGFNYEYSPAGNVTTKNTAQGNYSYQYDPLYRLTGATNPTATESFTYDPVGNRLTGAFSCQPSADSYTYNANNELIDLRTPNSELRTFEYDANGNITSKTDQTGTTTYTYDVDNRLVQVRNPQSEIYNYYYDPFGKRLWKEVNGVMTNFFYADEGLIGEYNASGIEIKTYGYAPNSTWTTNPLFQKIGTSYYWYQNDHLGTSQKIVDTSGRVVWSATSDAFGRIQITVAEIENNLRFPGQYYDQETGLHYNWNRYYDPKTGRYLTPDPIGLDGRSNLFAYVRNNPVNVIDPTGLFGAGGPNEEFLGHGDFTGSDCFDYNREDSGVTSPYRDPERHFRDLEQSEADISNAIASCRKEAFERAMHRGQDYFTHYAKGYRWKPGDKKLPCFGFGHTCMGTLPDEDDAAWAQAESWTKKWVKKMLDNCKCCNPK
jgi:RHS repeat-associated protein